MKVRVAIVGGGIAGLFTASELMAAGVDDLVVLEADPTPGGVVRTVERDGYQIEPGAGSVLLPHPELSQVLAHLQTDSIPATGSGTRYLWNGKRLIPVPASPAALMAPILPVPAKLRAALEPLVSAAPGTEETIDEFLRRRLGDGAGRVAAWLAASGVFAGDPTRLSADAAFPRLTRLEETEGSLVRGMINARRARPADAVRPTPHVPVGGMAAVIAAASGRLGDRLRTSTPVEAVGRGPDGWTVGDMTAEIVVLACDPATAAGIVGGPLGDCLRSASSAPVVVVGLGGPSAAFPIPDGFGILTGPDAATHTRGILLESSSAPQRAPDGHTLVKVIAGGEPVTGIVDRPDGEIVEIVGDEVARILGTDIAAELVHVVRPGRGIPQYRTGHRRWLAALESLTPPSLHLTGWAYQGVGVQHQASDAVRLAGAIAS